MTVRRFSTAEAVAAAVEVRNDLADRAAYWRRRAETWDQRSLAIALEEHVDQLDALVVHLRATLRDQDVSEQLVERVP